MNIEQIKQKLQNPLLGQETQKKMAPFGREFNFPKDVSQYKESAVLLTLIPKNGDLYIPFIKRTSDKGTHSGQISFPGGKVDETDENHEFTAKREAFEEIGLNISDIEIIGKLSKLHIPVSGFVVYPFVGVYPEISNFKLNKSEVEELVLVKLSDLFNDKIKKSEQKEFQSKKYEVPYFDIENQKIWGATAMMLNEFIEMIRDNG